MFIAHAGRALTEGCDRLSVTCENQELSIVAAVVAGARRGTVTGDLDRRLPARCGSRAEDLPAVVGSGHAAA